MRKAGQKTPRAGQPPAPHRKTHHPARQGRATGQARALEPLNTLIAEVSAYEARSADIEAAIETLKAHRPAFEALATDMQALMERTRQVFADARFRPFHCTADEVQQAFAEVGFPGDFLAASDQEAEKMVAAIQYVAAHREDQLSVARKLLMMVPEYVAARQYMEAWILVHSVTLMTETPDESNPFLFEMFGYGYEALERRLARQKKTLLQRLGLNLKGLGNLSFDEAEALVQAQTADPAQAAALEAYFDAHPELREHIESQVWDMERQSLTLLEREDAECLLLDLEELEPYLPMLKERIEPLEAQARETLVPGAPPRPEVVEAFGAALMEIARTMVTEIFTPDRVAQLVRTLKTYERDLTRAKDKAAAGLAFAAGMRLKNETQPADNPLLIGVCFASLRAWLMAMSQAASSQSEQDGEDAQEATP